VHGLCLVVKLADGAFPLSVKILFQRPVFMDYSSAGVFGCHKDFAREARMKNLNMLLFFAAFWCMGGLAWAEPHDRLVPLLVDLDGWQAQPAHGMSLISAQMKMINANRLYRQVDKNLTVNLMVNSGPVLASDLQESSSDNETVRAQTRQVEGFWVKSSHTKKNDSGQLIVYLGYNQEANAVLVVNYAKMGEAEALQTVASLDWQKLKTIVATML